MARISAFLFSRYCHRHCFFTLAPPRRAPPFLVRASGAVALKVAQVPSTVKYIIFLARSLRKQMPGTVARLQRLQQGIETFLHAR